MDINPTISTELVRSVQRDYQQAAREYSLGAESGKDKNNRTLVTTALSLATSTTAVVALSQYII